PPFSVVWSRHSSHLHSFPTRRSSDLERSQQHNALSQRSVEAFQRQNTVHAIHAEELGSVVHVLSLLQNQRSFLIVDGQEQQVSTDRKSTRLNSSHVSISYAVFCSKKK